MATKQIVEFPEIMATEDNDVILLQKSGGGVNSTGKVKKSTFFAGTGADNSFIGEVKYIEPSTDYGVTPVLPAIWAECNGAVINDAESIYDGYRTRNLNGGDVVLTLTWTADAGGSYATVPATDITGLNVGDWVTGSGIEAGSLISDITGTTVTITDIDATGEIESTFTNDGVYIGGGSGGSAWDQMQGWQLGANADSTGAREYWGAASQRDQTVSIGGDSGSSPPRLRTSFKGDSRALIPKDDGTNGTPRISNRTKPHTRHLKAVMRIK